MKILGMVEIRSNVWAPVETAEIPETYKLAKTAAGRALPYPATRAAIDGILIGASEGGGLDLEELLDSPAGRSLLEARSVAPPGVPPSVAKAEPVTFDDDGIVDYVTKGIAEVAEREGVDAVTAERRFFASHEGRVASMALAGRS